jgi:glutathione-independent formaldehyde dehydrogenase
MPGMAGAAYGFAGMGPYAGGQAQYLRVPHADFNCLQLPDDATTKEKDYVMLSDIFPTGWHATGLADLKPGESILIYGAGPVGLMAALSARIQGASQIFVVDGESDRLALAKQIGATAIATKMAKSAIRFATLLMDLVQIVAPNVLAISATTVLVRRFRIW